jgi:hypothetical protein
VITFAPDAILPPGEQVRRILVLRTAPMAQVRAAVETLRAKYPNAKLGVLGSRLEDPFFEGFDRYEIPDGWLTPGSFAPFRRAIAASQPDLAVLCLNSDHIVGYARASAVLGAIPAGARVVAGYSGGWTNWSPEHFAEPGLIARVLVDALMIPLYVVVPIWMLLKPSTPRCVPGAMTAGTRGEER